MVEHRGSLHLALEASQEIARSRFGYSEENFGASMRPNLTYSPLGIAYIRPTL